ncbi:MAG: TetR/AcrR family transcriptional regulator [candidate division Zixibacteria bacterium]|nr:TetR/AcrR family transcriptional regulator [candidate division Zixibacteria bacterium]
MNESQSTLNALIVAARALFARNGYEGTSIKAITTRAKANLGAVTYHFGTKEQLYHAVLRSVGEPFMELLLAAAAQPGSPLDRIEAFVRAFFNHLCDHGEMPSLMMHELSLRRPVPSPLRGIMGTVFQTMAGLIREGQKDGTIIGGEPRLLVVSVLALPAYVMWMRVPLGEVIGLDTHDHRMREQILDHIVISIRRSIEAQQVKRPKRRPATSGSRSRARRRES